MPRGYSTNPTVVRGPATRRARRRPCGSTCVQTFTTNANIPHNALPGCELTVANTSGMFGQRTRPSWRRSTQGGDEPDCGRRLLRQLRLPEAGLHHARSSRSSLRWRRSTGRPRPDNPCLPGGLPRHDQRGRGDVGIKQVAREVIGGVTQAQASVDRPTSTRSRSWRACCRASSSPTSSHPLRGDSNGAVSRYLRRSNDVQSSIRYRAERTSIIGVQRRDEPSPRSRPSPASSRSDRMRLLYPDTALLQTEDELGERHRAPRRRHHARGSDGRVGREPRTWTSPHPWTNRRHPRASSSSAELLDAVEQNQVAVAGRHGPRGQARQRLRVRQGFTTDMENVLTKTPTVRLISD
jgi:hypothetical protein